MCPPAFASNGKDNKMEAEYTRLVEKLDFWEDVLQQLHDQNIATNIWAKHNRDLLTDEQLAYIRKLRILTVRVYRRTQDILADIAHIDEVKYYQRYEY
jgi:hypothetical protein